MSLSVVYERLYNSDNGNGSNGDGEDGGSGGYLSEFECIADLRLVFANCQVINGKGGC